MVRGQIGKKKGETGAPTHLCNQGTNAPSPLHLPPNAVGTFSLDALPLRPTWEGQEWKLVRGETGCEDTTSTTAPSMVFLGLWHGGKSPSLLHGLITFLFLPIPHPLASVQLWSEMLRHILSWMGSIQSEWHQSEGLREG